MQQKIFNLKSKYSPAWDQESAIKSLLNYLNLGYKWQTLWWVTWSWKTFTMANVIQNFNKPTLVIAHNKTLAAQLAQEFKEFFPDAAVHYFVSYYDYYQPEAYVKKTDTYIEKEATINEEIDRLRHAATQSLITRKDVIIVASVSCIYGIWDISMYQSSTISLKIWQIIPIEEILLKLVAIQYKRANSDFKPWNFLVSGDLLEIFPSSSETVYTLEFWWNEITQITRRNYLTWEIYEYLQGIEVFPAKHTVSSKERIEEIVPEIKKELEERLAIFKESSDVLKYERLKTKVEYDIEMMQEVGYVNWIENYSRYLDWRASWEPPATLIDFFGNDFLTLIDESHMTIPQIGWMFAWDKARKENLVENGFRLPSAMDNRPLKFEEFENKLKQVIAISATPWEYETKNSCSSNPSAFGIPLIKGDNDSRDVSLKHLEINNSYKKYLNFSPTKDWVWFDDETCRIVSQIIRPTWLLDPLIEIKSMEFMIDDVMTSIEEVIDKNERMLITTVTKRSSEELTDYLLENWIKVKYLHSEVETLDRLQIIKELREWKIDVIVWVNLLREWLDLPEVSKIAIVDADKQGFLRSEQALIQIIWRAARNENWKVVMYVEKRRNPPIPNPFPPGEKGDELNKSFSLGGEDPWKADRGLLMWEEIYRIDKWKWINKDNLFISNAMRKAIELNYYRRTLQNDFNKKHWIVPKTVFSSIKEIWINTVKKRDYILIDEKEIKKEIARLELEMDIASANTEFEKAAELRDQIIALRKGKKEKSRR